MQVAGYGQHTNNTIPSAIRWALVERLNRTLINMLSLAVTDQQASWENHLPTVCMAYNTSVQTTTRHTPFFLMFGRQARLPVDIMFGSPTPVPTPTTDYVQNLKETLEKSYQLARVRMGLSLKRQKDLYDQRIHGHPYQPGDLVWLHCPAVPKGCSKKLYRPWKGPFRVLRSIGNTTYHIKDVKSPRKKVYVHFNRLKPYSGYEQQATNTTSGAPRPATVENPDLYSASTSGLASHIART